MEKKNTMMKIKLKIPKQEIVYVGKIKKSKTGQGYVHMNDQYIGNRAYVIMPQKMKRTSEYYEIVVDEIQNIGVHPNNDHTCKLNLSQKYVGRKCIVIIADDF